MINDVSAAPTFDLNALRSLRSRPTAATPADASSPRPADQATFGSIDGPTPVATDDQRPGAPGDVADLLERLPEEVRGEVSKYLTGAVASDHYSPQNTADRIVSFVLSGFARYDGGAAAKEGTAEARQRFVDFILPAIDRGFSEALDLLGDLAKPVTESIQETRGLIGQQLDEFAASDPVDVEA